MSKLDGQLEHFLSIHQTPHKDKEEIQLYHESTCQHHLVDKVESIQLEA